MWDDDSALPEWTTGIEVEEEEAESNSLCNTRKDRFIYSSSETRFYLDKRVHRHTFGVFLLCWPCGIVVCFDELFSKKCTRQGHSFYV